MPLSLPLIRDNYFQKILEGGGMYQRCYAYPGNPPGTHLPPGSVGQAPFGHAAPMGQQPFPGLTIRLDSKTRLFIIRDYIVV